MTQAQPWNFQNQLWLIEVIDQLNSQKVELSHLERSWLLSSEMQTFLKNQGQPTTLQHLSLPEGPILSWFLEIQGELWSPLGIHSQKATQALLGLNEEQDVVVQEGFANEAPDSITEQHHTLYQSVIQKHQKVALPLDAIQFYHQTQKPSPNVLETETFFLETTPELQKTHQHTVKTTEHPRPNGGQPTITELTTLESIPEATQVVKNILSQTKELKQLIKVEWPWATQKEKTFLKYLETALTQWDENNMESLFPPKASPTVIAHSQENGYEKISLNVNSFPEQHLFLSMLNLNLAMRITGLAYPPNQNPQKRFTLAPLIPFRAFICMEAQTHIAVNRITQDDFHQANPHMEALSQNHPSIHSIILGERERKIQKHLENHHTPVTEKKVKPRF